MKRFFFVMLFSSMSYAMYSDTSGSLPGLSEKTPLLIPTDRQRDANGYEALDELLNETARNNAEECVAFIYKNSNNRNARFLKKLLLQRASDVALSEVMPHIITRSVETEKDRSMKLLMQILVESQRAETEAEREQTKIMKEQWDAEKADRIVQERKARRAMIINGIMFLYSSVSTVVNFLQAYNLFSFDH